MARPMVRGVLLFGAAAVALGGAAAAADAVVVEGADQYVQALALQQDDDSVCSSSDPQACALELRQLRVAPLAAAQARAQAAADALAPDGAAPLAAAAAAAAGAVSKLLPGAGAEANGTALPTLKPRLPGAPIPGGVPGGWGEAAEYVFEVEETDAADDGLASVFSAHLSSWGYCALYQCASYYRSWATCQCNPGCVGHGNCCHDYYEVCTNNDHRRRYQPAPAPAPVPVAAPAPVPAPGSGGSTKTLYHNTSPEAGASIVATGFRPGTQGWCGGGIYFAETAEATLTKAIGPDSHQGYVIEAVVNVGLPKYLGPECDRSLNAATVSKQGYGSVSFDPGDGREWIVYDPALILSMRHVDTPR
mmetsp:Transcript_74131/g.241054  ORF Transcript_74131/g.241054 Transcript_74131/m.241054 type:complete len:362 (+) Transcript_74131:123-1208(+)